MKSHRHRRFLGGMLLWLACVGFGFAAAASAEPARKVKELPIPSDESLGFFGNTRDEVLSQVKRVGMFPVKLPEYLEDRDETRQQIEALAIQYVAKSGIEVVGSDRYQSIYDKLNKQLGGVYDAETGAAKPEQLRALRTNTLQQFVLQERLSGYLAVSVVRETASFSAIYADWAGVRERIDGQPEASGVANFFLAPSGGTGKISALTLVIQILNTQGRLVYGRTGGVQLMAYSAGAKFEYVALTDLLRDSQRLERAVKVASMPLVRTPKEIAYGDADPEINLARTDLRKLPAPPKAAKAQAISPFGTTREEVLASVRRVGLSRVSTGGLSVPDSAEETFLKTVRQELTKLGWEVVDAPLARDALVKKVVAAKIFDPYTGKQNEQLLADVRKSTLDELQLDPTPDAMVWVGVTRTSEQHDSGNVEWDGANQCGLDLGPVKKALFFGGSGNGLAGNGVISAMSFTVLISDRSSNRLYQSRGGVELLQKLNLTTKSTYNAISGEAKPVDRAPTELFQDEERIKASVHYALRDLTLTPEELEAELNPKKKKK